MRYLVLLAGLGISLSAVSCNENDPSSASTGGGAKTRLLVPTAISEPSPAQARSTNSASAITAETGLVGAAPVQAPVAAVAPNVAFSDVPPAPSNAQWTIYCATIKGPSHIEQARDLKRRLIQLTSWKDWYIVHGAEESTMYYGFYRAIDDPKDLAESKKAQAERHRLDAFKDSSGERPFSHCMFVELTTPNPEAPMEWDLTRAPDWAVYTVQIAAEKNTPDRKKNAAEIVRKLREKNVEAYFFHGPSVSSVCVGLWPAGAIKQPVIVDKEKGISNKEGKDIVIVDPNLPQATNNMVNEKGERVIVAQPKPEIVDPRLIATMREYPNHEINGMVMYDAKTKKPFEHSFVAAVPPRSYSYFTPANGTVAASPRPAAPAGYSAGLNSRVTDPSAPNELPAPQRPGGSRLKSLDR